MKARNNKTGEIVTNFFMSKEFGTISYLDSSKTLRLAHACDEEWTMLEDENDDFSNSFDWQSFRAEAAKDILSNALIPYALKEFEEDIINIDYWTERAILFADSLISKLKEK